MINIADLKKVLSYDPETGLLHWLPRPADMFSRESNARTWAEKYVGREAFTGVNARGYKSGRILGKRLLAHRVAWAIHHGAWPTSDLDHRDGVRTNNRITNLRDGGAGANAKNAARRKDNSSGFTGVHWHRKNQKWRATISVDGHFKHLGMFDDLADAVKARAEASERHGFTSRHGTLSP